MAPSEEQGDDVSTAALVDQAEKAIQTLASRSDVEAFNALLSLSTYLGEAIGDSARLLAAHSSWTHVGEASGTTKQAAWSRWSG